MILIFLSKHLHTNNGHGHITIYEPDTIKFIFVTSIYTDISDMDTNQFINHTKKFYMKNL
jgi:hypothetical protein